MAPFLLDATRLPYVSIPFLDSVSVSFTHTQTIFENKKKPRVAMGAGQGISRKKTNNEAGQVQTSRL